MQEQVQTPGVRPAGVAPPRRPLAPAPRGRLWRRRPDVAAGLLGALVVVVDVVLPVGPERDLLYAVAVWGPVAAVAAGLARYRPRRARVFWLLMLAGLTLNAVGEVIFVTTLHLLQLPPFPGPASVAYVAAYVTVAVALVHAARAGVGRRRWSLHRRRAGDAAPAHAPGGALLVAGGALDALTVLVAVGLPMWLFLVSPAVTATAVPLGSRVAVAAYSLSGAVVAALVLALLTDRVAPPPALRLLAVAGGVGLFSTLAFQALTLLGHSPYRWVNPGLLLALTLVAVAALHPSMRSLARPPRPGQDVGAPSRGRMVLLAGAVLVAPACFAVRLSRSGELATADAWALLLGGAVMSLLVLGRLAGVLGQVQAQARDLEALARTDPLTGLANRRRFEMALDAAVAAAAEQTERDGRRPALSVLMLDLDHFKAVNDEKGHAAGDAVLRAAALGWSDRLRGSDVLARLGGEEFAVVLPGSPLPAALEVAEDLRTAMADGVTVSVGVAGWAGEDPTLLLQRADEALYRAKREGRNRVVAAAPAPAAPDARLRPSIRSAGSGERRPPTWDAPPW